MIRTNTCLVVRYVHIKRKLKSSKLDINCELNIVKAIDTLIKLNIDDTSVFAMKLLLKARLHLLPFWVET